MRVWTAAEVGRFLEFIWEERLGPLYILAATSGARRGELLGLRWADLDLDATPPVMRIRRTLVQYGTVIAEKEPKTPRSRRTVALDAAAVAALRRHRIAQAEERLIAGPAYTNDDRVFADEIGRPLTPRERLARLLPPGEGGGAPAADVAWTATYLCDAGS